MGPNVAGVGVAEVRNAAVVVEHDFGGVDVEEGAGVGDHAEHVLITVNPDFAATSFVFSGGFAPSPQNLTFSHSIVDFFSGGFGGGPGTGGLWLGAGACGVGGDAGGGKQADATNGECGDDFQHGGFFF